MNVDVPLPLDVSQVLSPSLVLVREALEHNLREMLRIAGSADRLRPHCKTHKMAAVTQRELALGITRHKCATFAEAEMLADAGVTDIFLAYNVVGPNIARTVAFRQKFPQVTFAVTADDPDQLQQLDSACGAAEQTVGVFLDIDPGLHRTGTDDPARVLRLVSQLKSSPSLQMRGFHLYDGHNHQVDVAERKAGVLAGWTIAEALRARCLAAGFNVPKIVCGGTGSFPIFAELDDPDIELSPGTTVFHDTNYGSLFPDLHFQPALWILTRVVSRPTPTRLTLDVGNKAVAADPPKGQRLFLPALPDAVQVLHNEEHLVLETPDAARYRPGDVLWAVPRHVCPTTALHRSVTVSENRQLVDQWIVTARDRQLTI
jgi:D-threonine aldolase